jgi:hypothetical protein
VSTAIVAFAAVFLACWLLVARTRGGRAIVGIALLVLGFLEIAAVKGWFFTGATESALVILALATVATLIAGIAAEEALPVAAPFRRAPVRVRAGTLLGGACSLLTVGLIVFFLCGVWAFGAPASTPSATSVLPAPSGLAVVANADRGCDGTSGAQTVCSRSIELRAPTATVALTSNGAPGPQPRVLSPQREQALGAEAVSMVTNQMKREHGWHLVAGPAGAWHSCRIQGWWLDQQTVCASITVQRDAAMVTLATAADW